MPRSYLILAAVLFGLAIPRSADAQPQPAECCFTATCVSCAEVANCENSGLFSDPSQTFMPIAVGTGFGSGLQNCGINHPQGILCTSWTQNSSLEGADCLGPACVNTVACNAQDFGLTAWENASISDNDLCIFPDPCEDCEGECLEDINANDICDCFETFGCMDSLACNYIPESVWDLDDCTYAEFGFNCNGSCSDEDGDGVCLLDEVYGCTDTLALNYHPFITEGDSSCVYATDFIVDCASCEDPCPGDLNSDLVVSVSDILILLTYFTLACPE